MPEGPEIKRAADKIAAAIAGHETTKVFFAFEHLKPYEGRLTGQTVTTVEARSKAMLVRFANGLNIYSHNQLYGKWQVVENNSYPETNRQLRLAIHAQNKAALLYSASDIEVLTNAELEEHPYLSKLGPDLLDESVTVEHVVDRLMHKSFYRRLLTSLLLDQQFLAGMGNYLRSEVLFVAGVHPSLKPVDCSPQQIRELAKAAINLTRQSYQTDGITNDLERVEQLRQAGLTFNEYRFRVFNRADEPCYICGTTIIKDEAGGRRIFYCPSCQKWPA